MSDGSIGRRGPLDAAMVNIMIPVGIRVIPGLELMKKGQEFLSKR